MVGESESSGKPEGKGSESHGLEEAGSPLALLATFHTAGALATHRLAAQPLLGRPGPYLGAALALAVIDPLALGLLVPPNLASVFRMGIAPLALALEVAVVDAWLRDTLAASGRDLPSRARSLFRPVLVLGFVLAVVEAAGMTVVARLGLPTYSWVVIPRLVDLATHWYFLNVLRAALVEGHSMPLALGSGFLGSLRMGRYPTVIAAAGIAVLTLSCLQLGTALVSATLGSGSWTHGVPAVLVVWWAISAVVWSLARWHFDLTWLVLDVGRDPQALAIAGSRSEEAL